MTEKEKYEMDSYNLDEGRALISLTRKSDKKQFIVEYTKDKNGVRSMFVHVNACELEDIPPETIDEIDTACIQSIIKELKEWDKRRRMGQKKNTK